MPTRISRIADKLGLVRWGPSGHGARFGTMAPRDPCCHDGLHRCLDVADLLETEFGFLFQRAQHHFIEADVYLNFLLSRAVSRRWPGSSPVSIW